jgi:hypothetical protein
VEPEDIDELRIDLKTKAAKKRGGHKTDIANDVLIARGTDPVEMTPGFIASPQHGMQRYHNDELHLHLMELHKRVFSGKHNVSQSQCRALLVRN